MNPVHISEFEQKAASERGGGFLQEVLRFLWQTKKWWMLPIVLALVIVGVLIFLSTSAAAPFIYTLF
jgi:Family of unknown function (DUF5989)